MLTSATDYALAHKRARKRLGPARRSVCPTCGHERKLELSYVGPDGGSYPCDPTGLAYIYECHSCNMSRRSREAAAAGGRVGGASFSREYFVNLGRRGGRVGGYVTAARNLTRDMRVNGGRKGIGVLNARQVDCADCDYGPHNPGVMGRHFKRSGHARA